MGRRGIMLAVLMLVASLATAAPARGGPPAGGPTPGGHPGAGPGKPARPPPAVRPPGHPGHAHRPAVNVYYGRPYGWVGWGGWGWPGAYWPYYGVPGYYRYYGYSGTYGPGYYYGPYGPYGTGYGYLPPAIVYGPGAPVTPTTTITYIEREPGTDTTPPTGTAPSQGPWWYFCASPRGAYPYVRDCPGGWERVPAIPPESAR